ncbi:hypothetical protein [uncultured Thiodictyon sp.]|uniref:hypothetical protein n=1 Tax=uncultured Thiodictyon sp. TaxID=1846217 RepID=UPI002600CEA2|nr:hypothetical protein [uncultured Thiodictyon sp.]
MPTAAASYTPPPAVPRAPHRGAIAVDLATREAIAAAAVRHGTTRYAVTEALIFAALEAVEQGRMVIEPAPDLRHEARGCVVRWARVREEQHQAARAAFAQARKAAA